MKQEKKLQGKVGIMGGTFDPIHIGHLILAEQACAQFKLDRILFMPTSHPPHKDGQAVTEAALRRDMVLAAIRGNGRFLYSDMELKREGVTYTSDTLAQLKEEYPNTEFYFIWERIPCSPWTPGTSPRRFSIGPWCWRPTGWTCGRSAPRTDRLSAGAVRGPYRPH